MGRLHKRLYEIANYFYEISIVVRQKGIANTISLLLENNFFFPKDADRCLNLDFIGSKNVNYFQ